MEPCDHFKFLTADVAERAIDLAVATVFDAPGGPLTSREKNLHVGVIGRVLERYAPNDLTLEQPSWLHAKTRPVIICAKSFGDPGKCTAISQDKALQQIYGLNDDRSDIMPHHLSSENTRYWGAAREGNLIGYCSGIEPWYDKMISRNTLTACVAMAYDAWERWKANEDPRERAAFLT